MLGNQIAIFSNSLSQSDLPERSAKQKTPAPTPLQCLAAKGNSVADLVAV